MGLWEKVFAAGYDRFMAGAEKAGLRDMRRELLAAARGRTLELGAGTGANVELYPAAVTELVLAEPADPTARRERTRAPRPAGGEAPARGGQAPARGGGPGARRVAPVRGRQLRHRRQH